MKISWLTATLDLPVDGHAVGRQFWSAATGYAGGPPADDASYLALQPRQGTPYLALQRLESGEPRVHLDFHVADLAAAVAHAESLGARLVSRQWWAVLESPGGVPFCLAPAGEVPPTRALPTQWPSGRSIVDQVCLDIAHDAIWEAEVGFWGALTGWPIDADDQWARLWTPADWPVRVLLQRRLEGGTTAHLDVSAEDQAAEVGRWEALGATVVGEGPRWTVLDTPGGIAACITQREPDSGLLRGSVPPPGAL